MAGGTANPGPAEPAAGGPVSRFMALLLLSVLVLLSWLILLAACWPLALLAGVLLVPLALSGLVLGGAWVVARGVVELATALLSLPFRAAGIGGWRRR